MFILTRRPNMEKDVWKCLVKVGVKKSIWKPVRIIYFTILTADFTMPNQILPESSMDPRTGVDVRGAPPIYIKTVF